MPRHMAKLGTLTITSGGTNSTKLSTLPGYKVALDHAVDLIVFGPAALTAVNKVAVSYDAGTTFRELNNAGTDVAVAAGDASIVPAAAFNDLRIQAASAEGADRDFVIFAQMDVGS